MPSSDSGHVQDVQRAPVARRVLTVLVAYSLLFAPLSGLALASHIDVDDQDDDGETATAGDCSDTDPTVNTAASETYADGVDQDCDGVLAGYVFISAAGPAGATYAVELYDSLDTFVSSGVGDLDGDTPTPNFVEFEDLDPAAYTVVFLNSDAVEVESWSFTLGGDFVSFSDFHTFTDCDDGLDNDGDGFADLADDGCMSLEEAAETGEEDGDLDGLSDDEEVFVHGTDPADPDTDGDGLEDGDEVFTYETDPLAADEVCGDATDNDGDLATDEVDCVSVGAGGGGGGGGGSGGGAVVVPSGDACPVDETQSIADSTSYGYVACTTAFGLRDPAGAAVTTLDLEEETMSGAVALPFAFTFYGEERTQLFVSPNGFVRFDPDFDAGCCSGDLMPFSSTPNGLIAGGWVDLGEPDDGTLGTGTLSYWVSGVAPDREFVVEFEEVTYWSEPTGGFGIASHTDVNTTFQIVLHEASNDFEIQVDHIDTDAGATIGWEDCNGLDGVTLAGSFEGEVLDSAWRVYAPATQDAVLCDSNGIDFLEVEFYCDFTAFDGAEYPDGEFPSEGLPCESDDETVPLLNASDAGGVVSLETLVESEDVQVLEITGPATAEFSLAGGGEIDMELMVLVAQVGSGGSPFTAEFVDDDASASAGWSLAEDGTLTLGSPSDDGAQSASFGDLTGSDDATGLEVELLAFLSSGFLEAEVFDLSSTMFEEAEIASSLTGVDAILLDVPDGWIVQVPHVSGFSYDPDTFAFDFFDCDFEDAASTTPADCPVSYSTDATVALADVTITETYRVLRLDGTGGGTARATLDVPPGLTFGNLFGELNVVQVGTSGAMRVGLRDIDGETLVRPGLELKTTGVMDLVGTAGDDGTDEASSFPVNLLDVIADTGDATIYGEFDLSFDYGYGRLTGSFVQEGVSVETAYMDEVPLSDLGFDEIVVGAGPGWIVDLEFLDGHGHGFGGDGCTWCGGGFTPGETSFEVLVLDDDASDPDPVEDARVEIYGDWAYSDVNYWDEDFTGEDGIASFELVPPGHFIVSTCVDGIGCAQQAFHSTGNPVETVNVPDEDGSPTGTIELQLSAFGFGPPPVTTLCGGTLEGLVFDEDGGALAGVYVNVWQAWNPDGSFSDLGDGLNGWGWAQTDANGQFTITGLGNSDFDLYVDGSQAGLASLYATRAFTVSGAVSDGCEETDTDLDGDGVITDGDVDAVVDPSAFSEGTYELDPESNAHVFLMADGMTISGSVFEDSDGDGVWDADEEPVEDADVWANTRWAWNPVTGEPIDSPQSWGYATTDENGLFTIRGLLPIGDEDARTGFDIYVQSPAGSDLTHASINFPEPPVQGDEDTGSPENPAGADAIDDRLDFGLAEAASLEGTVFLDEDGDGVLDASEDGVGYAWINMGSTDPANPAWGWGQSDDDGEYEITGLTYPAEYQLQVWPPWGSSLSSYFTTIEVGAGANPLDLPLDHGVLLEGCIEDAEGDEVVGAWISMWAPGSFGGGWGETDEEGCFEIFGLQASSYNIDIWPPWDSTLTNRHFEGVTLDAGSPGFDDEILTETEAGFELHDEDDDVIVLGAAGTISGCVVSADGIDEGDDPDPVQYAWVGAWSGQAGHWSGGMTGTDGCFTINGLVEADDYYVSVWPPWGNVLTNFGKADVEVETGEDTYVGDGILDTDTDDDTVPDDDVYILLGVGHTIVGDIVDEDGNPVANVGVCAWREDNQAFAWAMTDANGHFEIRGVPTDGDADDDQGWFLWIGAPTPFVSRSYPMDPYSDAVSPFDVDSADNELSGFDDAQVAGASLATRVNDGSTSSEVISNGGGRLVISLTTDDDETYIDTNFVDPEGDWSDPTPGDFEYGDGEDEEPIVLSLGETLTGFVVVPDGDDDDADLDGVANARVWVWGPGGWGYDEADSEGAWEISGLGEGDYDLWVETPDGLHKYETGWGEDLDRDGVFDLDEDQDGDGAFDANLDQGCQIDGAGEDEGDEDPADETDDDGEVLDGCVVEFESPGALLVQVNAGDDDSGVWVQLFGPSYADGYTGDEAQAADDQGSDNSDDHATDSVGDDFGEVFFANLAPGVYGVRFYRADCYVLFEGEVTIVADETEELEVALVGAPLVDAAGSILDEDGDGAENVLVLAIYTGDADGDGLIDEAEPDLDGDGLVDPEEDLDGDGTFDVDEDSDGDGEFDAATYTTSTDENGDYAFEDLPEGAYKIIAIVDEDTQAEFDVTIGDLDGDGVFNAYDPDMDGDGLDDDVDPDDDGDGVADDEDDGIDRELAPASLGEVV